MPCIYFHPEAYTTEGRQVMGRHVAGESFLKGYLRFSSQADLALQIEKDNHYEIFHKLCKQWGVNLKQCDLIKRKNINNLSRFGSVFYPGPNLAGWARIRSLYGDSQWSLCGVTHTISSDLAMDNLCDLVFAPLQPWDALICTSKAVKRSTEILLERQIRYIGHRFRAQRCPLPQLPVIPLGVDASQFTIRPKARQKNRKELGIQDNEIVVLYVGRLSFHAKANPAPMYKALQSAAKSSGQRVVLIECGWFYSDFLERSFLQAGDFFCPLIKILRIDGRDPKNLQAAWSCADIFCSFSDNIQETFGITPVEAMAAGLPVIVSDWNGYKDTVRDGIDGFRITTTAPSSSVNQNLEKDFACGVIDYDLYLGLTSLQVSVSIPLAFQAFHKLLSSSKLRRLMGENGRKRVLDIYDWSVIIPQYERLWKELGERRKAKIQKFGQSIVCPYPSRPDPFDLFDNYSTVSLELSTKIKLNLNVEPSLILCQTTLRLKMFAPYRSFLLGESSIYSLIEFVGLKGATISDIVLHLGEYPESIVFRSIAFLFKIDMFEII